MFEIEEKKQIAVKPKTFRTKIGIAIFLSLMLVVLIAFPTIIITYEPEKISATTNKPIIVTTKPNKKPYNVNKLSENEKSRINCFLEEESRFENLTRFQCKSRGCIYAESEYERVPTCYFDRENLGYILDEALLPNNSSYKLKLKDSQKVPYMGAIQNLNFIIEYLDSNIINIKIKSNEQRYEVPYPLNKPSTSNFNADSKARVEVFEDPTTKIFSFKIIRNSDNEVIFDTSFGGFVYCDQFIQISTRLNSSIYGLGENNHEQFQHDFNYRSWGIFARDNAPGWGDNKNLYGTQPVYLGQNPSGKSHLVMLYNSNSMEYIFTPAQTLTLRTIGGILDFYFVVDDHPESVLQSYHQLIGLPVFPPYWSFGFQICRWGYQNLTQVQEVINRTAAINLPHDVQYIDIEYMIGYRIFTVDQNIYKGLGTYMKEMRKKGLRLVLILDPGLVIERNNSFYMTGVEKDVYVKWPNNLAPYDKDNINQNPDDVISWCWPNGKISYPDFMNDITQKWWEDSLRQFMNDEINGCDVDGIWIDMNEPSSFETNELKPWNWQYPENDTEQYPYFTLKCPTNRLDDPPYRTKSVFAYDSEDLLAKKARLSQKTLCMIHKHRMNNTEYYHYDVHNLYAHAQSIATYNALEQITNLRPFSLTRSNYVGTGHYAVHWLGDNDSTWKHMKMSIIGLLEYNIFGIPMVGADICGFFIDIQDAEMCTRWLQLGSFYTFTRNHNANLNRDKDPASYGNKTLEDSTRNVLRIRYTILPYIYTMFYHVHSKGGSVARPLFFEFPTDSNTLSIDEQFMLGSAILVSPVLNPGQTKVKAYFPDSRWYDYRSGTELIVSSNGWMNISAPLSIIPIHLRGGIIIPTQDPLELRNTTFTRKNPMGLIVSLDKNNEAKGDLFWDDGESFNFINGEYFHSSFEFQNNVLNFTLIQNTTLVDNLIFNEVKIYGYSGAIKNFDIEETGSQLINQQSFSQTENTVVLKINAKIGRILRITLNK